MSTRKTLCDAVKETVFNKLKEQANSKTSLAKKIRTHVRTENPL